MITSTFLIYLIYIYILHIPFLNKNQSIPALALFIGLVVKLPY